MSVKSSESDSRQKEMPSVNYYILLHQNVKEMIKKKEKKSALEEIKVYFKN